MPACCLHAACLQVMKDNPGFAKTPDFKGPIYIIYDGATDVNALSESCKAINNQCTVRARHTRHIAYFLTGLVLLWSLGRFHATASRSSYVCRSLQHSCSGCANSALRLRSSHFPQCPVVMHRTP